MTKTELLNWITKRGLLAEQESKDWPEQSRQRNYRLGMAFAFQEVISYVENNSWQIDKDTQWHFPSKGEFPAYGKRIEYAYTNGTRMIGDTSTSNELADSVYCWRYCDPLPPIPEVKADDNGFEKWRKSDEYRALVLFSFQEQRDKHIWLAAQSALQTKREKEKE